ncbi:uncharacterized protein LOC110104465 isoform X2 [Dendrobium catenatum]|uniref:uncharacterized protein LOC110104465 isoform X2 n=1 Tax=Dendrobium catenatum TaxID=906689 RepID=UPI00109FCFBB|nr:uncharacterized protein LOC110104465 isoform X2 [Dendrobium catenatum]
MLIKAVAQASAVAGWPIHLTNLGSGICLPLQATKCSFSRILPAPLNFQSRRLRLLFVPRAADSTPPASASPSSSGKTIVSEEGFTLSKYAELKPVPCITYSDAQSLREKCATPILKQVRDDVTRFRYGDEQHLDEALKRIFQYGLGGGISRRSGPILKMIREEVVEDEKYCLVLVFEAKALQLSDFEQRQAKFASFFGPGITAEIGEGEGNDLYEVRLISQTTAQ